MKRWSDLLIPLLPASTIITGIKEPLSPTDIAINALFLACAVLLWLTLRD